MLENLKDRYSSDPEFRERKKVAAREGRLRRRATQRAAGKSLPAALVS
jgi:hypothetical protein